jgi:hypothetical protein
MKIRPRNSYQALKKLLRPNFQANKTGPSD